MSDQAMPTSPNPGDYARSMRVEDDEILMIRTQLDEKWRQVRRHQAHVDMLTAEGNALKERMFIRLDELYPNVRTMEPNGGVGVRQWEDAIWYVGW